MKKKENIITFLIIFALSCLLCFSFLTVHYATDTYNIIDVGYKEYGINWSLKDGRLIMFFINMIADVLHIDIKVFVVGTLLIAIILACLAVVKLKNIFLRSCDNEQKLPSKLLITAIAYGIIFNFMFIDCLYFVECIVMAGSILCITLASDHITKKSKKEFLISLTYIVLAVFCYQGTIGFFLGLTALVSIIKNKNNIKSVLTDVLKSIAVIGIAVILNLIFATIVMSVLGIRDKRFSGFADIPFNILFIILKAKRILISSSGLFPSYAQILFSTVIVDLVALNTVLGSKKKKALGCILLVIAITILGGFSTNILTTSSFYAGRTKYAIGALVPIIMAYVVLGTNIKKDKIIFCTIVITFAIYSGLTMFKYYKVTSDSKRVDKIEKADTQEVLAYIDNYEHENNIEIKEVVLEPNERTEDVFCEGIQTSNSTTYNSLRCEWSIVGAINYYGNKHYKKSLLEYGDKYLEDDEFYKCIDDKLYVKAVFMKNNKEGR